MGIQGLLRAMKPFTKPVHVSKYTGQRVGIDAYSWLHKGAYSCSMELCVNGGKGSELPYLQYFMHRINLLRHHHVTPVVVFDGGNLTFKSATENQRQRNREANLVLAQKSLEKGDVTSAIEFFQRAVCITPSMAHQLIQILRAEKVEFVVAPYEADAQLAYLSSVGSDKGGIAAVITEDSDLLAYGCEAIIFKMDRNGNGEEILLDEVFNSTAREFSLRNFDKQLFTGMCVLAGCDFLPSVPGIGIKRAHGLVSKYRNLDRVLSVIKVDKSEQMPEGYCKSFREAVAVFHHARIFDSSTKSLKPMKPLTQELLELLGEDMDFLGPEIPCSIAVAIAEGHLDPITMEAFDCSQPTEAFDIMQTQQTACFATYKSSTTREEKFTVTEQRVVSASEKRMLSNEALALRKLVFQLKACQNSATVECAEVLYPNNNPFKKRKTSETFTTPEKDESEPISAVIDAGDPDENLCNTPESQASVESKLLEFKILCNITNTSDNESNNNLSVSSSRSNCCPDIRGNHKNKDSDHRNRRGCNTPSGGISNKNSNNRNKKNLRTGGKNGCPKMGNGSILKFIARS